MVLTLQTIEYIEDSYHIWLILLHFINKKLVWPVTEQSLNINKTHFSPTSTQGKQSFLMHYCNIGLLIPYDLW